MWVITIFKWQESQKKVSRFILTVEVNSYGNEYRREWNIQIGELTINEMLNASQDKEYGDVDLSERSENELENAIKILSKERFGILCKGFTQYYMKKMYCRLAIFFTVLHAGGESLKGVITPQDNIFWWLLLFVGVLFLGFMGFISWAFNKMRRDNHSINELFKENWAKKALSSVSCNTEKTSIGAKSAV